MKSSTKVPKVNARTLARTAAKLNTDAEFNLRDLLKESGCQAALKKIEESLSRLEKISQAPDKNTSMEATEEFHKTDKSLDKLKTKVNDLQKDLEKIAHQFDDKIKSKFAILQKTDARDAEEREDRTRIEGHIKSIQSLIEHAKKKLEEITAPTEAALKRFHAIKPKLYALGLTDNIERCQKRAKNLFEEMTSLCLAVSEMSTLDSSSLKTLPKEISPEKTIMPALQTDIEKSIKLLQQAAQKLLQLFPESQAQISDKARDLDKSPKQDNEKQHLLLLSNGHTLKQNGALTTQGSGNEQSAQNNGNGHGNGNGNGVLSANTSGDVATGTPTKAPVPENVVTPQSNTNVSPVKP